MRSSRGSDREAYQGDPLFLPDAYAEREKDAFPETSRFCLGKRIRFVLLPDYSFAALAAAIEPLRLANFLSSQTLFTWATISALPGHVRASNGVITVADETIGDCTAFDTLIVCGGAHTLPRQSAATVRFLRKCRTSGVQLGAIYSGTGLLAMAGLLRDRRVTAHWASAPALRESYPDVEISERIFEIDPPFFSAGTVEGVSDLLLHFIEEQYGRLLVSQIASHLGHPIIRDAMTPQTAPISILLGARSKQLDEVLKIMEENIEDPLPYPELAKQTGLSLRQLQRLFKRYLGRSPGAWYRTLRLQRARYLLLQTSLPVTEIAVATGFVSPSHFSKLYREEFGSTPSGDKCLF